MTKLENFIKSKYWASIWLLLGAFSMSVSADQTGRRNGAWCEKQWDELIQTTGQDYKKALASWQALQSKCSGTGVYEAYLSNLFYMLGDEKKAAEVIEEAKKLNTDYNHYVRLMAYSHEFQTSLREVLDDPEHASKDKFKLIIEDLKRLASEKPDWAPVWERLSNIETFIDLRDDAVEHALKASSLNPNSASSYRNLVIAYAKNGEYDKARPLISKTIELDQHFLSDPEFMYASSWLYTASGEFELAAAALERLRINRPEVEQDPQFKKVAGFLRQEAAKANHK